MAGAGSEAGDAPACRGRQCRASITPADLPPCC